MATTLTPETTVPTTNTTNTTNTTSATTDSTAAAAERSPRVLWPWAGAAAAVLGAVATLFMEATVTEAEATGGAHGLVQALNTSEATIRISCGIGLLATVALLIFASGLQRRLEDRGVHGTTAGRVMDKALTASAGAMFIGFGARAMIAGSLPDGVDGAFYSDSAREAVYSVLNNFPYVAWMGVAIAAGAAAVLGLRHRSFSKPVAIVGLIAALIVTLMTLGLGLPYSAGIVGPLWVLAATVSMVRERKSA